MGGNRYPLKIKIYRQGALNLLQLCTLCISIYIFNNVLLMMMILMMMTTTIMLRICDYFPKLYNNRLR